MPINQTRQDFFIRMPRRPVHKEFKHEPASSEPASPAFPGALTTSEQAEVLAWKRTRTAAAYTALTAPAKTKADEYIAYEKAFNAWKMADLVHRENQWHWFVVDSAIMTYDTTPPSGSGTGTGSGAAGYPVIKHEP